MYGCTYFHIVPAGLFSLRKLLAFLPPTVMDIITRNDQGLEWERVEMSLRKAVK